MRLPDVRARGVGPGVRNDSSGLLKDAHNEPYFACFY